MKINQIFYALDAVTANNGLNNNSTPFSTETAGVDWGEQTTGAVLNNNSGMYGQMLLYFIAVIAVVAGLLFLRKYLTKRLGTVKNGSYMRIIDRVVIAQDKQIALVELKSKILIVGITQQRIETLGELDRSEFDVLEQENPNDLNGKKSSSAFVQMLGEKLNNKSNENDKK